MQRAHEDILTQIFILALIDEEQTLSNAGRGTTRTALTVSAVCRDWRQIALSYPALWRLVTIYVRNAPSWQLEAFRHFASLGKNQYRVHLLDFGLKVSAGVQLADFLTEDRFTQKIDSLCIFRPRSPDDPGWSNWDLLITPLRYLKIMDYSPPRSYERFPDGFGRAKHVEIKGGNFDFSFFQPKVEWELFHLEMSTLTEMEMANILRSAQDLRHLTLRIGAEMGVVLPSDCRHSKLESLNINFWPEMSNVKCDFPSLRRLETPQASEEFAQREPRTDSESQAHGFLINYKYPERIEEIGVWLDDEFRAYDLTALATFSAITRLSFRGSYDMMLGALDLLIPSLDRNFPTLMEVQILVKPQPEFIGELSDLLTTLLTLRHDVSRIDISYSSITSVLCNVRLSTSFYDYVATHGILVALAD